MKKIKTVFYKIGEIFLNPLKTISTINVSDRFIDFMNKHLWIRLLISLVITGIIMILVYFCGKELVICR